MKKLLTASLPALALLALGGCTATRSVATTEDDGVYYSSKDRTTALARAAAAPQPEAYSSASADTGEATNPDYQAPASSRQQASNAPEYYDDNYTSSSYSSYDNSRFRRPYAGPTVGLAYYAPPVVFAPVYSYGWGAGDCGFSPYGSIYCDPFYSAYSPVYYQPYGFYRPFGYGYGYGGPFVSIAFGYGRPWGGYGYGRPYYGGYGYDRYYGYGGYNRAYGYGGYYGGPQIIRNNGGAPAGNPVLVGRRAGRGGDVLAGRGATPTAPTSGTTPTPNTPGGRRRVVAADPGTTPTNGLAAPAAASATPATTNSYGRRAREVAAPNSPTAISDHDQPTPAGGRYREPIGSRADVATPPTGAEPMRTARGRRGQEDGGTANGTAPDAGRRYEQPQQADGQPIERTTRRPRLAEPATGAEANQPVYRANRQEQPAVQPQMQQPQPQRTYERPQRTYEQPATTSQPQRSYERPAASQPSYSAPAGGGGSNGGGGGGRRGRF